MKEFLPGEYAEDVIHVDDALRNLKDRLKVVLMVATFPIALVAMLFTIPFYKERNGKN